MNVQLIALDMDGTTLQDDHLSISLRTEQAIKAAVAKGIVVVPATGRLDTLLPQSLMRMDGIRYAITSNGAATYDMQNQKMIYSDFIQAEVVQEILNMLPLKDVLVEIFRNGKLLVERSYIETLLNYPVSFLHLDVLKRIQTQVDDLSDYVQTHSDQIEKINMPFVQPEYQNFLWEKLSILPSIALTSSIANNMEINSATANKGAALQKLCEFLKIAPENVIAMGDNGNDIEMLQFAGTSIAMGNATDGAKSAATTVTLPSNEDGVAIAIEKYALNI